MLKLTKTELRSQQGSLNQLEKYLPTLQLKKAMLQAEVHHARAELVAAEEAFSHARTSVEAFSALIAEVPKVRILHKRYENVAGIEVPYLDSVEFESVEYDLFETPPWTEAVILGLQRYITARLKIDVAREKCAVLEKELREVSIRVNLFEKRLIPRANQNIRKIKVSLSDQQLAAVSQAKVAKKKILCVSN